MAGLLYYKQSKVCGLIYPAWQRKETNLKKEGWNVKVKTSVDILTHTESE